LSLAYHASLPPMNALPADGQEGAAVVERVRQNQLELELLQPEDLDFLGIFTGFTHQVFPERWRIEEQSLSAGELRMPPVAPMGELREVSTDGEAPVADGSLERLLGSQSGSNFGSSTMSSAAIKQPVETPPAESLSEESHTASKGHSAAILHYQNIDRSEGPSPDSGIMTQEVSLPLAAGVTEISAPDSDGEILNQQDLSGSSSPEFSRTVTEPGSLNLDGAMVSGGGAGVGSFTGPMTTPGVRSGMSTQVLAALTEMTSRQAELIERGGRQHFQMTLAPDELGEVVIEIQRDFDGSYAIRVAAASSETRGLFHRQSELIQQSLQDHHGMLLSQFDVLDFDSESSAGTADQQAETPKRLDAEFLPRQRTGSQPGHDPTVRAVNGPEINFRA